MNTSEYLPLALPKWGVQNANLGSKFRWRAREVKWLAAPFLHYFLQECVPRPESADQGKALGAWGLEPEGLTAEMHSVLFKSPSSPTVNSGILAYLLSKTLKAGLKNIWTVLATMQGACGQQGVGEKAPP